MLHFKCVGTGSLTLVSGPLLSHPALPSSFPSARACRHFTKINCCLRFESFKKRRKKRKCLKLHYGLLKCDWVCIPMWKNVTKGKIISVDQNKVNVQCCSSIFNPSLCRYNNILTDRLCYKVRGVWIDIFLSHLCKCRDVIVYNSWFLCAWNLLYAESRCYP